MQGHVGLANDLSIKESRHDSVAWVRQNDPPQAITTTIRGAFALILSRNEKQVQRMKELNPKAETFMTPGVLAVIAGLILIASGVTSGSLLLTGLGYVSNYLGPSITPEGDLLLRLAIGMLTFIVGLGGILVVAGGVLLLRHQRFAGTLLMGLGGGMAVFGLLFSMAEALYVTGFSAPVFHQSYFTLFWLGSILATIANLLASRAWYSSILARVSRLFSRRSRSQ